MNGRGERLLLHIGIIDILQSYRCSGHAHQVTHTHLSSWPHTPRLLGRTHLPILLDPSPPSLQLHLGSTPILPLSIQLSGSSKPASQAGIGPVG